MRRYAIVLFFILVHHSLDAQSVFFESYFGTELPDCGRALRQYNDSAIYEAGYTVDTALHHSDVRLCKADRFGNMLWTRTYGDVLDDDATGIEIADDGDLLVCGETQTTTNGLDAFLMKLDTSGNVIWEKFFGGPLNESFVHMAILANGNIALVGFQSDAGGSNDMYVVLTDASGNYLWSTAFGGAFNDVGKTVCALPDSGFIVFGDTRRSAAGDYNIEGVRFSNTTSVLWDSTYAYNDTLSEGCQGAILLSDGNLLVYGEGPPSSLSWFDFLLHKIDMNGNTIWFTKTGGALPDAAFSVLEVPGGFFGTGYSQSFSAGPNNIIVFRSDAVGNLLWAHPYGGTGIDIGYEVIPALGGGFFIGGTGNVSGDDQFGLLHVDDGGWAFVDEEQQTPFTIWPNPSDGQFFIQTDEKNVVVEIYAANGRLVYSGKETNPYGTFGIRADLTYGAYMIRVIGVDKTLSGKFLVK